MADVMPMNTANRREEEAFIYHRLKKGISHRDIETLYIQYFGEGVGQNRIQRIANAIESGKITPEMIAEYDLESQKRRSQLDLERINRDQTQAIADLKTQQNEIITILTGFYQLFVRNIDNLSDLTSDDVILAEKAKKMMQK